MTSVGALLIYFALTSCMESLWGGGGHAHAHGGHHGHSHGPDGCEDEDEDYSHLPEAEQLRRLMQEVRALSVDVDSAESELQQALLEQRVNKLSERTKAMLEREAPAEGRAQWLDEDSGEEGDSEEEGVVGAPADDGAGVTPRGGAAAVLHAAKARAKVVASELATARAAAPVRAAPAAPSPEEQAKLRTAYLSSSFTAKWRVREMALQKKREEEEKGKK